MLLAFIHWPQEGIPTSGYSQSIFRKEGLSIPTSAWGRGGMRIWICFQTTTLPLRWRYLKNRREKLQSHTHTHTHTHWEWEQEGFLMVWTCLWGDQLFLWDETRRWQRLFVEPSWRFPFRKSLQFSAGLWEGGFGRQLNFQANDLLE